MKILCTRIIALACCALAVSALAQTTNNSGLRQPVVTDGSTFLLQLPLEAVSGVPASGTFWSAQLTNYPPMPADFLNFPVYEAIWTNGDIISNQYVLDDRAFNYPAYWASLAGAGRKGSGEGPPGGERGVIITGGPRPDVSGPPVPGTPLTAFPGAPVVNPDYQMATGYAQYSDFWLVATNNSGAVHLTIQSTLSNLTYQVLTNDTRFAFTNWHIWTNLLAKGTSLALPSITVNTNVSGIMYKVRLVWATGTSGLPDWWQMLYFNQLSVNPNADPMQDGLSNLQKYQLGLSPNVSYLSQLLVEPPGGTNTSMPVITVFSLTNGATIHYTTDGSTPSATHGYTTASGVALTNIPNSSFTLKAWEQGFIPTTPVTATYTLVAGAPTFSLPAGVYPAGTQIQITCLPTNATVRYTTNGTLPTTSSPAISSTAFLTLTANQTINATAWYNSVAGPIASASYLILAAPPNDNFSNATVLAGTNGEFRGTTVASTQEAFEPDVLYLYDDGSIWYKWTAPTNGTVFYDYSRCANLDSLDLTIYYIPSNGTNPSNLVNAAWSPNDATSASLTVTQNVAYYLRFANRGSGAPIDVLWHYYSPAPTPIFSPDAGTYTNAQLVSILDNDPNAIIRYTTNGTTPTTNSAVYNPTFPIFVYTNETLKAAAWRTGLAESSVYSATYTINPASPSPTVTVASPSLSPPNTNFASSLVVTLTCTNPGAAIHYTTNGNIPTPSDPSVASGGTVTLTNTVVFSAKAWVTGLNPSSVTTAAYARNNFDTDHDGIPDTAELTIGSNPDINDASAVNPNPFAHGLDNYQVYENPSVLLADNYSTAGDGVPDWWKIQNGYNIHTSAALVAANGQTLLADYTSQINPALAGGNAGVLPPIDFHLVPGPTNNVIVVLDSVDTSIVDYLLFCTNADPTSPSYGTTKMVDMPADTSMPMPGQPFGRYYPLSSSQLPQGTYNFALVGSDAAQNQSQPSTYALTFNEVDFDNGSSYPVRLPGAPYIVDGYTNKTALKESVLAQELRATSPVWLDSQTLEYSPVVTVAPPLIADDHCQPFSSETYWSSGIFDGDIDYQSEPVYFPAFCATPNAFLGCDAAQAGDPPEYPPLSADGFPGIDNSYLEMAPDSLGNEYNFNYFGLQYLSLEIRINSGTPFTLTPGAQHSAPNSSDAVEIAQDLETPVFHSANYYFDARSYPIYLDVDPASFDNSLPPVSMATAASEPDFMYLTGNYLVPTSTTNPLVVAQVGKPLNLQGWRAVVGARPNGQALNDLPYWIQADFAQAYLCDPATGDLPRTTQTNWNGKYMIDTNAAVKTGILSPTVQRMGFDVAYSTYTPLPRSSVFTPTQPGKIILATEPDGQGQYGELVVYVIDMQVDANHDGIMDNRDLTSLNHPMQFWANNNYDRNVLDNDDSVFYDDDVAANDPNAASPGTPGVPTPDYNYLAGDGKTACIPNLRDLQDYTRLWIPGLSNTVANLPTNYTVTLQWRNNVGASIRLFKAAETNGGTNYQFNQSMGLDQLDFDNYPCYGTVSPTQTISLDQAFASTTVPKPSDFFIFCGGTTGNDELVCQVKNPYGGVVGEASVFLNIKDIKQMYERWSVGEYPQSPITIATNCGDVGSPSFSYPYDPGVNATTPYILYVHGWNMPTWEKDRFAESAFKRLYWQGYQGRFGVFRWPTDFGFTGNLLNLAFDRRNYDYSENQAWLSALGLKNRLTALNIQYPGQVYVLAHSMGNVVTGEALRLAGMSQIVNTYVATQAAVPAHVYDATVTNSILNNPVTPNIYNNWFQPNIGGSAGRVVSFFNTNDYALQSGRWEFDQTLKPDNSITIFGGIYGFDGTPYNGYANYHPGSVDDNPPWLSFVEATGTGNTTFNLSSTGPITDRYQVMSYAAQARSTALGRTAGVTTLPSLDLSTIWPSDTYPNPPYGAHFYHSAQFRGDYWQQTNYWHTLLLSPQLGFHITP